MNATDTIGNIGSGTKTITVDTDRPTLQIDWPPWVFREQYLNSSFNLNLTAYDASQINYTIYTITSGTVEIQSSNVKYDADQAEYSFNDSIDVSSLSDGKYYINFSAIDSKNNYESKLSWFAVDKSPPVIGSAYYSSSAYSGATQTIALDWFNNSLQDDDNLYGVEYVDFYYNITTNPLPSIYNAATPNYNSASATIVNIANYSYSINSTYVNKNIPYIH